MKLRRIVLLGAIGAAVYGLAAGRREPAVTMHELDWPDVEGEVIPRRYRSPGHLLHHLRELAALGVPLARVYALRALTPAFREQIMITTALTDSCPP